MKDLIKFEALYGEEYYGKKDVSFVCEDIFPSDMTNEQILFCVNEGTRCSDWCMETPQFKTTADAITVWEHYQEQEARTEVFENGAAIRHAGCMCGHVDFKIIERVRDKI
jgi:hypothetical protein